MNIGIFCSANNAIDAVFFSAAEALGQWAAAEGHTIVFGGVNQGLMECVAKAAKTAGGRTVGVVPRIVEQTGRTSAYNDEVVACHDLTDRKEQLVARSDVFVALPGGIGTLDEVFTVAAAHTIGYHEKHVILFNVNGFWDAAVRMLDDLEQRGFVRGRWRDYIEVAESLDDVIRLVTRRASRQRG